MDTPLKLFLWFQRVETWLGCPWIRLSNGFSNVWLHLGISTGCGVSAGCRARCSRAACCLYVFI